MVGVGSAAASMGMLRRPEEVEDGSKRLEEKPGMARMVGRVKSVQGRRLRMSHQQCRWMPVPMERRVTGRTAGLGLVR